MGATHAGVERYYVESLPGERSAAWWLSLGRSPEQIRADLRVQLRLTEEEAWVAVERALARA